MIRLDADRWLSELMALDAYRVSGALAAQEMEAAASEVRASRRSRPLLRTHWERRSDHSPVA
jgi:hypothetical protein